MQSHSHTQRHPERKPTPASPRPGRPQPSQRPTTRDARSPQLGLRDADVVQELTATSR
jgi:hypothetical protein